MKFFSTGHIFQEWESLSCVYFQNLGFTIIDYVAHVGSWISNTVIIIQKSRHSQRSPKTIEKHTIFDFIKLIVGFAVFFDEFYSQRRELFDKSGHNMKAGNFNTQLVF